ncbi:MAG: hypothetical protein JRI59_11185 [Deltaproteobacteria bacterium]|nr:hypothetical protein [Deltaproteobacteria bacterium]
MSKGRIFLVLVAIVLLLGVTPREAGPWEKGPAPEVRAGAQKDKGGAVSLPATVTLEPFYLIREKQAQVWVERIILTLTLVQPRELTATFNDPRQRGKLFELIAAEAEPDLLAVRVQAELNRTLGEPVVTAVHLSRSFLLL